MARALSSVFCDDVRQELGGKLSLMGIYHIQMLVPNFPYELPKLFVGLKATASDGEEFKALKFLVMLNDDIIAEIPVASELLEMRPSEPPEIPNASNLQHQQIFQTYCCLPPLTINQPSIIRTRIVTERETISGEGLMIALQQQPSS